ncbi:DNA adenine methylase [Paenibacillus jiagnxiensis]|uniref:DNA adenine methylase n=1 Tax=Paenibacillus jiagnxiensis TaxID=3228926 RepID=UPI0033B7EAC3
MDKITMLDLNVEVPHFIKYMGSKKKIINFVIEALNEVNTGGPVCDLFAGSSVLSGILRNQANIISNDIQSYSAVLAKAYLTNYDWNSHPFLIQEVVESASKRANKFLEAFSMLKFDYERDFTVKEFVDLEDKQRQLIHKDFGSFDYHLFTKNYSGTYWSFNQCVWIDAYRATAEEFRETPFYSSILASLMFAMSYNSQSTGHYAQFRDATSQSSMEDILTYRRKEITPYFIRKMEELQHTLGKNCYSFDVFSLDYRNCLDQIPENTVVYADPPYAFVHYSRFYHAIETLVRYDYPKVRYKGRYREDRHQSPFCIKTQVEEAFYEMFLKIRIKQANLVLSYSNTGMIDLDDLIRLAKTVLGKQYTLEVRTIDYLHSTMGRREDKSRNVQEALIIAKRI